MESARSYLTHAPVWLLCSRLAALVLLMPLCWVHSAPTAPISSGEDMIEDRPISALTQPNSVALAKFIEREAVQLRNKLCDHHAVCDDSIEMLAENNLKLPHITTEDGCFLSGFRKEKCLHKIHHGLVNFDIYLLHMEQTFTSDRIIVESIRYKTTILAENVKMMMKRPNTVNENNKVNISLADLKSENLWLQKVTNRLILQAFIDLVQKSARAVRFIGTFHNGSKNDA
ncbi:interleukin-6 [Rhinophrynus dorsalis]